MATEAEGSGVAGAVVRRAPTYSAYNREALKADLRRDEGWRGRLYRDSDGAEYHSAAGAGRLTIGVGWNIEDNGLPDEMLEWLLEIGIDRAEEVLDHVLPAWRALMVAEPARARALLNMAYNLGAARLREFSRMLAAAREAAESHGDTAAAAWRRAAAAALDSLWAQQVGPRAIRIAGVLETGSL